MIDCVVGNIDFCNLVVSQISYFSMQVVVLSFPEGTIACFFVAG
jgi:hypothetical protein